MYPEVHVFVITVLYFFLRSLMLLHSGSIYLDSVQLFLCAFVKILCRAFPKWLGILLFFEQHKKLCICLFCCPFSLFSSFCPFLSD